jgi:hypothetical protein
MGGLIIGGQIQPPSSPKARVVSNPPVTLGSVLKLLGIGENYRVDVFSISP